MAFFQICADGRFIPVPSGVFFHDGPMTTPVDLGALTRAMTAERPGGGIAVFLTPRALTDPAAVNRVRLALGGVPAAARDGLLIGSLSGETYDPAGWMTLTETFGLQKHAPFRDGTPLDRRVIGVDAQGLEAVGVPDAIRVLPRAQAAARETLRAAVRLGTERTGSPWQRLEALLAEASAVRDALGVPAAFADEANPSPAYQLAVGLALFGPPPGTDTGLLTRAVLPPTTAELLAVFAPGTTGEPADPAALRDALVAMPGSAALVRSGDRTRWLVSRDGAAYWVDPGADRNAVAPFDPESGGRRTNELRAPGTTVTMLDPAGRIVTFARAATALPPGAFTPAPEPVGPAPGTPPAEPVPPAEAGPEPEATPGDQARDLVAALELPAGEPVIVFSTAVRTGLGGGDGPALAPAVLRDLVDGLRRQYPDGRVLLIGPEPAGDLRERAPELFALRDTAAARGIDLADETRLDAILRELTRVADSTLAGTSDRVPAVSERLGMRTVRLGAGPEFDGTTRADLARRQRLDVPIDWPELHRRGADAVEAGDRDALDRALDDWTDSATAYRDLLDRTTALGRSRARITDGLLGVLRDGRNLDAEAARAWWQAFSAESPLADTLTLHDDDATPAPVTAADVDGLVRVFTTDVDGLVRRVVDLDREYGRPVLPKKVKPEERDVFGGNDAPLLRPAAPEDAGEPSRNPLFLPLDPAAIEEFLRGAPRNGELKKDRILEGFVRRPALWMPLAELRPDMLTEHPGTEWHYFTTAEGEIFIASEVPVDKRLPAAMEELARQTRRLVGERAPELVGLSPDEERLAPVIAAIGAELEPYVARITELERTSVISAKELQALYDGWKPIYPGLTLDHLVEALNTVGHPALGAVELPSRNGSYLLRASLGRTSGELHFIEPLETLDINTKSGRYMSLRVRPPQAGDQPLRWAANVARRISAQLGMPVRLGEMKYSGLPPVEDNPLAEGLRPTVSQVVPDGLGGFRADGMELMIRRVKVSGRDVMVLVSDAEWERLRGRNWLPATDRLGAGLPVVAVHNEGGHVRVPARLDGVDGEVLLTPDQLRTVTERLGANQALLSCEIAALRPEFVQAYADALGGDVLAAPGDLLAGAAGGRLLTRGGDPWLLFTPEGLGESWDTLNDLRSFDGFRSRDDPEAFGAYAAGEPESGVLLTRTPTPDDVVSRARDAERRVEAWLTEAGGEAAVRQRVRGDEVALDALRAARTFLTDIRRVIDPPGTAAGTTAAPAALIGGLDAAIQAFDTGVAPLRNRTGVPAPPWLDESATERITDALAAAVQQVSAGGHGWTLAVADDDPTTVVLTRDGMSSRLRVITDGTVGDADLMLREQDNAASAYRREAAPAELRLPPSMTVADLKSTLIWAGEQLDADRREWMRRITRVMFHAPPRARLGPDGKPAWFRSFGPADRGRLESLTYQLRQPVSAGRNTRIVADLTALGVLSDQKGAAPRAQALDRRLRQQNLPEEARQFVRDRMFDTRSKDAGAGVLDAVRTAAAVLVENSGEIRGAGLTKENGDDILRLRVPEHPLADGEGIVRIRIVPEPPDPMGDLDDTVRLETAETPTLRVRTRTSDAALRVLVAGRLSVLLTTLEKAAPGGKGKVSKSRFEDGRRLLAEETALRQIRNANTGAIARWSRSRTQRLTLHQEILDALIERRRAEMRGLLEGALPDDLRARLTAALTQPTWRANATPGPIADKPGMALHTARRVLSAPVAVTTTVGAGVLAGRQGYLIGSSVAGQGMAAVPQAWSDAANARMGATGGPPKDRLIKPGATAPGYALFSAPSWSSPAQNVIKRSPSGFAQSLASMLVAGAASTQWDKGGAALGLTVLANLIQAELDHVFDRPEGVSSKRYAFEHARTWDKMRNDFVESAYFRVRELIGRSQSQPLSREVRESLEDTRTHITAMMQGILHEVDVATREMVRRRNSPWRRSALSETYDLVARGLGDGMPSRFHNALRVGGQHAAAQIPSLVLGVLANSAVDLVTMNIGAAGASGAVYGAGWSGLKRHEFADLVAVASWDTLNHLRYLLDAITFLLDKDLPLTDGRQPSTPPLGIDELPQANPDRSRLLTAMRKIGLRRLSEARAQGRANDAAGRPREVSGRLQMLYKHIPSFVTHLAAAGAIGGALNLPGAVLGVGIAVGGVAKLATGVGENLLRVSAPLFAQQAGIRQSLAETARMTSTREELATEIKDLMGAAAAAHQEIKPAPVPGWTGFTGTMRSIPGGVRSRLGRAHRATSRGLTRVGDLTTWREPPALWRGPAPTGPVELTHRDRTALNELHEMARDLDYAHDPARTARADLTPDAVGRKLVVLLDRLGLRTAQDPHGHRWRAARADLLRRHGYRVPPNGPLDRLRNARVTGDGGAGRHTPVDVIEEALAEHHTADPLTTTLWTVANRPYFRPLRMDVRAGGWIKVFLGDGRRYRIRVSTAVVGADSGARLRLAPDDLWHAVRGTTRDEAHTLVLDPAHAADPDLLDSALRWATAQIHRHRTGNRHRVQDMMTGPARILLTMPSTGVSEVPEARARASAGRTLDGQVPAATIRGMEDLLPALTSADDAGVRTFVSGAMNWGEVTLTRLGEQFETGSGAIVHRARGPAGTEPVVVKIFPRMSRFVEELSALERLSRPGFTAFTVPEVRAVGAVNRSGTPVGVLVMSEVNGVTLTDLLAGVGAAALASLRADALARAREAIAALGRAMADLHARRGGAVSQAYLDGQVAWVRDQVRHLPEGHEQRTRAEAAISLVTADPGPAGLVHGDAHPGNVVWHPVDGITFLDVSGAHRSIGPDGAPAGMPERDISTFLSKLRSQGSALGLRMRDELMVLRQAFLDAYDGAGGVRAQHVADMFQAARHARQVREGAPVELMVFPAAVPDQLGLSDPARLPNPAALLGQAVLLGRRYRGHEAGRITVALARANAAPQTERITELLDTFTGGLASVVDGLGTLLRTAGQDPARLSAYRDEFLEVLESYGAARRMLDQLATETGDGTLRLPPWRELVDVRAPATPAMEPILLGEWSGPHAGAAADILASARATGVPVVAVDLSGPAGIAGPVVEELRAVLAGFRRMRTAPVVVATAATRASGELFESVRREFTPVLIQSAAAGFDRVWVLQAPDGESRLLESRLGTEIFTAAGPLARLVPQRADGVHLPGALGLWTMSRTWSAAADLHREHLAELHTDAAAEALAAAVAAEPGDARLAAFRTVLDVARAAGGLPTDGDARLTPVARSLLEVEPVPAAGPRDRATAGFVYDYLATMGPRTGRYAMDGLLFQLIRAGALTWDQGLSLVRATAATPADRANLAVFEAVRDLLAVDPALAGEDPMTQPELRAIMSRIGGVAASRLTTDGRNPDCVTPSDRVNWVKHLDGLRDALRATEPGRASLIEVATHILTNC
ncbi:hypothetical protein [Catenuloplanes atrovinosus]|uniref:Lonely Cys domain-containing protein n=1 Tax=Catenuloplanes atrovinosus TaxID=137266 RepID=A0AAE3YKZ7_9ACTN|nr:hypothetical protein [Catenuloplanes atrovinosus]MDR7274216.1 hypothetical protein [Catenuloplanes atrovinosus]